MLFWYIFHSNILPGRFGSAERNEDSNFGDLGLQKAIGDSVPDQQESEAPHRAQGLLVSTLLPDRIQERAKAHRIGIQELVRLRLLGPRESTVLDVIVASAHDFFFTCKVSYNSFDWLKYKITVRLRKILLIITLK